jgi:uncharacterized membrane protein YeaQ/YmgE (transglycosylase-associated protein family)
MYIVCTPEYIPLGQAAPGTRRAFHEHSARGYAAVTVRNGGHMSIIAWILLGLVAGWLAGQVMRGGGYGLIGDIVLGIIGALVGGFLSSALLGVDVTGFNLPSILIAFVGAVVVIAISRAFSGRRRATA